MYYEPVALTPVRYDQAPWLYTMNSDAYIDLNEYESRADWEQRRKAPLMWWSRLVSRADRATMLILLLTALVSFIPGLPGWVQPAGLVALAISIVINVYAYLRLRDAKTNAVVAAPFQELHEEILLLSRTLLAVHALKDHVNDPNLDPAGVFERLDPQALEDLAKTILRFQFPHVDAVQVRSIRQDLIQNLRKSVGVEIYTE